MAYVGILSSSSFARTHVVSEILGLKHEKDFAKANNNTFSCQGKPLECCYYKDCGAD